jgi:hypothetical protein
VRLIVSPLDDGKSWVLREPFADGPFTVPSGFTTDFASVPRVFWFGIPRWGKYGYASIVHDWLYWEQHVSREHADKALLALMRLNAVPNWQCVLIYRSVRMFGLLAWHRNIADRKAGYSRMLSFDPIYNEPQQHVVRTSQSKQLLRHVRSAMHSTILASRETIMLDKSEDR